MVVKLCTFWSRIFKHQNAIIKKLQNIHCGQYICISILLTYLHSGFFNSPCHKIFKFFLVPHFCNDWFWWFFPPERHHLDHCTLCTNRWRKSWKKFDPWLTGWPWIRVKSPPSSLTKEAATPRAEGEWAAAGNSLRIETNTRAARKRQTWSKYTVLSTAAAAEDLNWDKSQDTAALLRCWLLQYNSYSLTCSLEVDIYILECYCPD